MRGEVPYCIAVQTERDRYTPELIEAAKRWTPKPTLPGSAYTSEAVWQDEREKVWFHDWVCIGRSEEVGKPGDFLVRDLAGESIFLSRNREGVLKGFYNVCSHRGTKFLDDDACGNAQKAFRCPYHAWTFDLDGNLIGTPNVKEDETFDRSKYPLFDFAVAEYAGFVFVNLSKEPRPLLEQIHEGAESIASFERFKMDELRIGARIVYEVAANWKIVVENYNECLHCPQVHPELVQVVPLYRFGEVWDESNPNGGNAMVDGATSFTPTGESELPKFPDLQPEDYRMYFGSFEFPNLMVNLHPDSVMYYIALPKGPNHTTVVSEFLFRPETIARPDFETISRSTVDFWDLISRQDWDVCSRAQTGAGSRAYRSGVYPRQDRLLFFFNQQYRRAMGQPEI